jgi:alkylation response protein AidB-like acyl-CoA dehydrogenase
MDFWLTDDQRDLQHGIRSFVQGRFPLDETADREETDAVIDVAKWREIGEMGVFSLRRDGFDNRSAVLVFEELGRGLVPGPLVATHLAAGLIDGAAEGTAIVSMLEEGTGPTLVEHAAQATDLIRFADGVVERIDPASLTLGTVDRPLDALTPVWIIADGEGIVGTPLSVGDAGALRLAGTVFTAAMQVGVAAAALELATAYAMEREQFGRPIGSFQAVKHMLAEMFVKSDVARSAVHAAACALDGASDDDPVRAASVAKVTAGDAALFCGKTGIQVHGGMGFTWEVHAQRYWKRAVVLDNELGTAEHHAQLVAGMIGSRAAG